MRSPDRFEDLVAAPQGYQEQQFIPSDPARAGTQVGWDPAVNPILLVSGVNTAQAVPAPDLYLAPPVQCSNRASGPLCLCDAWCTSSLTSFILLLVVYVY